MSSHLLSQRWQKAEMFSHAAAIPYLHGLGFKDILQPVSRAENASYPTSFPQWIHTSEHTTMATHPEVWLLPAPYFLYITPCPSQTHLEHKNIHVFCHTSHHRVGMNNETGWKNVWSNTQSWASGNYRKLASVQGGKKEPVALREVYSH